MANKAGRTARTQSGIRLVMDDVGAYSSGYLLVHNDDTNKVSWCGTNGYFEKLPSNEGPIIWDDEKSLTVVPPVADQPGVYPINTYGQHYYMAHNSTDAAAYAAAFTNGGFNYTLKYEHFTHRGVKIETWLFIREDSKK